MNWALLLIVLASSSYFAVSARKRFKNNIPYQSPYCRNYPLDDGPPYRFHKETGRCYMVGERGPCGELMAFTIQNEDFGICDCDIKKRCGRPLIYWPPKQRCYYVNDQGPCREGKWLVFGFDLNPVCKKNICSEEQSRFPSYEGRFWFSYKGKCFRTYNRGFCTNPDEILFNMATHYRPICTLSAKCDATRQLQKLKCLPGQRLDFMGKCQRALLPLSGVNKNISEIVEVTDKPINIHCLFCNRDAI